MQAKYLTLCIFPVQSVAGQLLQVVFEQQLVARNPLDRLQHVVLQRQVPAHVLLLSVQTQNKKADGKNVLCNSVTKYAIRSSGCKTSFVLFKTETRYKTLRNTQLVEVQARTCMFWTTLLN